ncbi:hypothetical protein V8G54_018476, partial [Vigna mungo]
WPLHFFFSSSLVSLFCHPLILLLLYLLLPFSMIFTHNVPSPSPLTLLFRCFSLSTVTASSKFSFLACSSVLWSDSRCGNLLLFVYVMSLILWLLAFRVINGVWIHGCPLTKNKVLL